MFSLYVYVRVFSCYLMCLSACSHLSQQPRSCPAVCVWLLRAFAVTRCVCPLFFFFCLFFFLSFWEFFVMWSSCRVFVLCCPAVLFVGSASTRCLGWYEAGACSCFDACVICAVCLFVLCLRWWGNAVVCSQHHHHHNCCLLVFSSSCMERE